MFNATTEAPDDRVHKYSVASNGAPVLYADAVRLWQHDQAFRSFFVSLLADSPFPAYRWETPPISNETTARTFEFVLINSPGLARKPDRQTYAEFFTDANADEGIVTFANLGKDAMLVVPSPRGPDSFYGHLAAFMRGAPAAQKHALWRTVGRLTQQSLTDQPLWVSSAGGGVAWLHVRLDSWPKYYGYAPYKTAP